MLLRTSYIYLFLFSIITFCVSSFPQSDFEGKIVMKITGKETSNMVYYLKGDNARMEVESRGHTVAILHNKKDSNSKILMDEQKMYMEFLGNDYMQKNNPSKKDNSAKVKKTDEHKKINGYDCEKWIFEDNGKTVEAWMTDQLGGFFMMQNPMGSNTEDEWKQKLVGNYFPMLVVTKNDSNKKETTMEVVSVDKMSLKKDLFEVPAGYKKFDMPNMPGMNK